MDIPCIECMQGVFFMHFEYMTKYLDFLEFGVKVRGAGFLRLECWGNTCNLTLQISGLFETPGGWYPVLVQGTGRNEKVGEVQVENGRGRLEIKDLNCDHVAGMEGFSVLDVERVIVTLDEKRKLVAVLREGKREEAKGGEEVKTLEAEYGEEAKSSKTEAVEELQAAEMEHEECVPEPSAETPDKEAEEAQEKEVSSYAMRGTLRPAKWEQLRSIYPTISPFGDSRHYLQISPGDFVILKERSYRMVNNSFLLHGYFTYKHLILHRMEQKGEVRYYVGVPGSFYDKEKEVAILFGFESFEGAAEPTREGDFGYYMMRVEL